MATRTGEYGGAPALDDPLAADAVQQRCDDLRAHSIVWQPEPVAPSVAPLTDAEKLAAATDALRAAQVRSRRRAALVRLSLAAEPVKERHYALQQRCPAADVAGWVALAEAAEDLQELDTLTSEAEALALLREVSHSLTDLERRLSDDGCSSGTRRTIERWARPPEASGPVERTPREDDGRLGTNPSTTRRWPSDDRTGPASLVVRQPVLSNAPPASHGPAHHLAAI